MIESTIYPEKRIVAIAVLNPDGKLLMGLRKDSDKFNCPGGHIEDGEAPVRAAIRELWEETGLVPNSLRAIGEGVVEKPNGEKLRIFCFMATIIGTQQPSGINDPDQECEHWDWVDVSLGSLPIEYDHNLSNEDDILLKYLGLQRGVIYKETGDLPTSEQVVQNEALEKGIPGLLASAMLSGAPMTLPPEPTPQEHHIKAGNWDKTGLNPEMHPIAQLESSNGLLMNHTPSPKGPFYTAFGALGFKPSTAFEEYQTSPRLQKKYPFPTPDEFYQHFTTNATMYKDLANQHWAKLRRLSGIDHPHGAAFLWHWGQNKPITPEVLNSDEYAGKYRSLYQPQFATKSEDLGKMALADIKPGKQVKKPGQESVGNYWKEYDYSHVLPDRKNYKLTVAHEEGDPAHRFVRARLYQLAPSRREVGEITATHWKPSQAIQVGSTVVEQAHRGKGLGQAMYEALYAHALKHLGATSAKGGTHSTLAMKAHKKLAEKHGLEYKPQPNYGPNVSTAHWENRKDWQDALKDTGGEFDERYAPYNYALKSEELSEELEKKILDPNLGITFRHEHHALDVGNNDISHTAITAYLPNGEKVGETLLHHLPNGTLESEGTTVHPEHRRKGIASGLYAHAQKITGKTVIPSSDQTPAGQALWTGNTQAPQFGKSVGYVTYPHFGQPSIQTEPMIRDPKTHSAYLSNLVDKPAVEGPAGYLMYTHRKGPESGRARRMSGSVRSDSRALHQNVAHEAQHSVFAALRQKFGELPVAKLISETRKALSPEELTHLDKISHHVLKQYPAHQKAEEQLAYLQNYLQDAGFRKVSHKHMGIWGDRGAEIEAQTHAKNIWKKLQHKAQELKPEHVGVTKSEDLEKGAMQRIAPFNPQKQRFPGEDKLDEWQSGWSNERPDKTRSVLPTFESGAARIRALHKLAADTKVRRNPKTGKVEYLLHRGMSPTEISSTVANNSVNHEDTSSWTPRIEVANEFAQQYHGLGPSSNKELHPGVISAWVPHDKIKLIPKQYGNLAHLGVGKTKGIGPNFFTREHEVIVDHNHNSPLATPEEKLAAHSPDLTEHGRINARNSRLLRQAVQKSLTLRKGMFAEVDKPFKEQDISALHMLGFAPQLNEAFKAAKFLVGGKDISHEEARKFLWECDGDYYAAALKAYGLEDNESNRNAISAHVDHQEEISKTEQQTIIDCSSEYPEAVGMVDGINKAIKSNNIKHIQLGGKHTAGSLLAQDPESGITLLLKPNAGGVSKAAGVSEESASQAKREGCWYQCAKLFGLEGYFPQACTVLLQTGDNAIDERASIIMLPPDWETAEKVKKADTNLLIRIVDHYLSTGILHQWATIDYILGNVDRHSNNALVKHNDIMLIDQGSAFAGSDFNPGLDKNSFVPFYLRVHYVGPKFHSLDPEIKLLYMPEISPLDNLLSKWVRAIDSNRLAEILQRYGINPEPTIARLKKVQAITGNYSKRINQLWIGV